MKPTRCFSLRLSRFCFYSTAAIIAFLLLPFLTNTANAAATKYIRDDSTGGDCSTIGTWDINIKTCTLSSDIGYGLDISGNDLTVDGAGHSITGTNSDIGVKIYDGTGITIKNLTIRNFDTGIYVSGPFGQESNNTLQNNNVSNNSSYGIVLHYSHGNHLYGNTLDANKYNFFVDGGNHDPSNDINFNNDVDSTNLIYGKPIYYLNGVSNQTFDASSNAGLFYCFNCDNVTIRDVTLTPNHAGVYLRNTTNSHVINVNASGSFEGIYLERTTDSEIAGSNASANQDDGINVYESSGALVNNNVANDNLEFGIYIGYNQGSVISDNYTSNNEAGGLYISESPNSVLNSNTATANMSFGLAIWDSGNSTMTSNTMFGNEMWNFYIDGNENQDYDNDIDTSNLIEDKPLYYVRHATSQTFDSSLGNIGAFYCINCTNVTFKNLTIQSNTQAGLFLWRTNNTTIESVASWGNYYGIYLEQSDQNTVKGNSVKNNADGIVVSGTGNTILGNGADNNNTGIKVFGPSNSVLKNNATANGSSGIFLGSLFYNLQNTTVQNNVSENVVTSNSTGIELREVISNTISGNTAIGNNGAGIRVWDESNNNTVSGNQISNNNNGGTGIETGGVVLLEANNNQVLNNTISNNSYGTYLYRSNDNSVYGNQFLNNVIQSYVTQSSGNIFNLPAEQGGGNHWSDWSGSGSYDFYGGSDGAPNSDDDLINKYRPTLFIFNDDYVPVPVDFMTRFSYLRDTRDRSFAKKPDIETLGQYQAGEYYLDQPHPASDTDQQRNVYYKYRDSNQYPAIMYAKVFRDIADESEPLNKKTVVQYWLCYYFNDPEGPIGEHEADWEMVEIIFNSSLQPEKAVYSQHNGGEERNWDAVWGTDSHPGVYIAAGTHANYFEPGNQRNSLSSSFDKAAGAVGDPLTEEWDASTDNSPGAERLYNQNWLDFRGRWGEPDGGPYGPKFNSLHQWTNPLGWWNGHNTISVNDTAATAEPSGSSQAATPQTASFFLQNQPVTGEPNLDNVPLLPPPPLLVNIYDSQGRRAGKDAAGTIYKEIPGSQYLSNENGSGTVLVREQDITDGYNFIIESQTETPFSVKLNLPQFVSNLLDQPVYNVDVPGPLKGRVVVSPAGSPQDFTMSLDTDGDGDFDDGTIQPTSSMQSVDFTKPADITDLNVTETGPGSVALSWTAPGDDGAIGAATSYEARYSTSAIVDEYGWTTADLMFDEPVPQAAGSTESYTTQDLPGGDYYFAIKTKDDVNLESGISNTVMASIPISPKTFAGKATATASGFTTIDVEAPYTDDENNSGAALVEYKLSTSSEWTIAGTTTHPETAFAINGLIDGSSYDVRVTYQDPDGVNNLATQTIKNVQPPARDHTSPVVTYGGPYYINSTSTTVVATYSDAEPSSGINADSAIVSINGGAAVQCTAADSLISCPVSGLAGGNNSITVAISDNDGNTGTVGDFIYVELVYFISDYPTGGDCTSIGNWESSTKTCTLAGDLNAGRIEIESDGITLDGSSYTVTGVGSSEGVTIAGRNNVTVKNLTVSGFDLGLYINSSGSVTLTGNKLLGNNANFSLYGYEDFHFNHNIDTSNLVDGRPIYYIRNAADQIFDSSTIAGTFYCVDCTNVTIKDLTPGNNSYGVFLRNTQNSRIENIVALNNAWHGIYLSASNGNYLIGNTANSTAEYSGGICLDSSSNNYLTNNMFSNNVYDGIDMWYSNGNDIGNNTISGNGWGGIYLDSSADNIISNNKVGSNGGTYNGYGIYMYYANNNSVFNNNFENNIVQAEVFYGDNNSFSHAAPEGGNYWDDFDTPSEGCSNVNGGGLCDTPYVFSGGQDNLPWAVKDGWVDNTPPTVENIQPFGVILNTISTINVLYSDPVVSSVYTSGINPASVNVTLDGSALSGCTVTETSVSCPVSGLAFGAHTIGGSVADNAGNTTPISGGFSVSALTLGLTSRLSTDSAGAEGNGTSYYPMALSADGNFTAFVSQASNLVSGDTNATYDVFVKKNNTGQATRISTDASGVQANSSSDKPSVSADGRYVAFRSNASNLVSGDTNNTWDVFAKDTQTGVTTRVSTTGIGAQANSSSDWTALSSDGRYVAFRSWANNLASGDTNAKVDIFVKDTQTGQITRVSTDSAGVQANGDSDRMAISADGRYVAFRSAASNLTAGDTNGKWDEFVKDAQTNITVCLTCQGDGDSGWPSISADGRYVTFPSYATNLVAGDTNNQRDIFAYDMQGGQTTRVSTDSSGTQANGYCAVPVISQDGRYIAFTSSSTNLVSGDTNSTGDIFIKDTLTGETRRYSTDSTGAQANNSSDYPAISADGKHVAFTSQASNLVSGDTNGTWDVFLGSKKSPPVIGSVQPSGSINTDSTTISVNYADGGSSGINTASIIVTLDGNALPGCTVTQTSASCPATALSVGNHIIGGSVSDNEGSQSAINGSFEVTDTSAPTVANVEPTGVTTINPLAISAAFADPAPSSGINPASVTVTLDGSALSGCTATETSVNCPVSGLAYGAHTIGGSVADNAGNTTPISGGFSVSALTLGLTSRLSTDSNGEEGNGSSYYTLSPSQDNNYTAFTSQASNLVSGDTNTATDVFVKNNNTGQTVRISTDSVGAQANGASEKPSISAAGRFVAFRSSASNLVAGDTNNTWDIFVKDTQTGATTRVSTTATGTQANSSSDWPSISADGHYVVFVSYANNLVSGDTNAANDIFVKDTQTGQVTRVSTDSAGVQANYSSDKPSLSADGRYIVFRSSASNLVSGDINGKWDEFVKDTQTGATICLTFQGNGDSGWPSMSADGRYVTFPSYASNLVAGDTNNQRDIFVYDLTNGQTTRVSTDSAGVQANSYCAAPAISVDGRYVAFMSTSTNLVAGDANAKNDIFAKDTLTGEIRLYSTYSSGGQANGNSDYPAISADGKYVAFVSQASNLALGDNNGTWDVFLGSKN